jgi:hypothetical protein
MAEKHESEETEKESKRKGPKDKSKENNKITDAIDSLKKNETIDNLVDYAKNNTQHTIALVLLLIGIIWFLFHFFYGGLLIGLVAGFYFSKELAEVFTSCKKFIKDLGTARSLVLAGTLLALFIAAPGIFIGAAIMVGLKIMLRAE